MGEKNVSIIYQMLYNSLLEVDIIMNYVIYKNEKFRVQSSGRYYQSDNKDAKERLLHRRIWLDNHGEIPDGYIIHHIDHNWKNNDISNLALMEMREHLSIHAKELHENPQYVKKNRESLQKAQEYAKIWHASEEGLKWHSEQAKNSWKTREKSEIECIVCGKKIDKYFAARENVRFCSSSCTQKESYKRYFNEIRNCLFCGKEFTTNRHRKIKYCSSSCGGMGKKHNKVIQYSKSGDFIREWNSVREAAIQTNTDKTSIKKCVVNKAKTAGGFIWKYPEIDSY